MVTSRRSRVIAIAAIIATIVFFLFSSDSRSSALATAQAATEKARGKAEKVNEQVLKPIAEDAKQLVGQEKPSVSSTLIAWWYGVITLKNNG